MRSRQKKLLVVLAATLAAIVAAAMMTISLDIRDKMSRELKSYGANIMVTAAVQPLAEEAGPETTVADRTELIDESQVPKLKTIFWRNNILDFAPFLNAAVTASSRSGKEARLEAVGTWFEHQLVIPTGETVRSGLAPLRPWWDMEGRWPADGERAVVVGRDAAERLALQPGDTVNLGFESGSVDLPVVGVAGTGDEDDGRIFLPLPVVQQGLAVPGKIGHLEVSALTTPENELARKAENNPDSLTPKEFELWYCTSYVSSVAYQLEEAIPGALARPVRRVSEAEGAVLQRVERLMWLLTLAALLSAGLSISSLMSVSILERRVEIGLAKAIGAESSAVLRQFLAEGAVLSTLGGLLGFALGSLLAREIGSRAFGTVISIEPVVLPFTLALSLAMVWLSSGSAMATIIRLHPKEAIFGR